MHVSQSAPTLRTPVHHEVELKTVESELFLPNSRFPYIGLKYANTVYATEQVDREAEWHRRASARLDTIPPAVGSINRKRLEAVRSTNSQLALSLKEELSRQAVECKLGHLQTDLQQCRTAAGAIELVVEMRQFLERGKNAATCDVHACLACIRTMQLPFEKRRRTPTNPVGEYLERRAELLGLLLKEERRRSWKTKLQNAKVKVDGLNNFAAGPREREQAVVDAAARRETQRIGLLSFSGRGRQRHDAQRVRVDGA